MGVSESLAKCDRMKGRSHSTTKSYHHKALEGLYPLSIPAFPSRWYRWVFHSLRQA